MKDIKKVIHSIENNEIYIVHDDNVVTPYERNTGAMWHKFTKMGNILVGQIVIDEHPYRFKLVPKKQVDKSHWSVMSNDRDNPDTYVPESWASQLLHFIRGCIMLGSTVHEFLLVPVDTFTLMDSRGASLGKYCGAKNNRPCFHVYLRNDNIKKRKGFEL